MIEPLPGTLRELLGSRVAYSMMSASDKQLHERQNDAVYALIAAKVNEVIRMIGEREASK